MARQDVMFARFFTCKVQVVISSGQVATSVLTFFYVQSSSCDFERSSCDFSRAVFLRAQLTPTHYRFSHHVFTCKKNLEADLDSIPPKTINSVE